jgi:predicted amidohydrolase
MDPQAILEGNSLGAAQVVARRLHTALCVGHGAPSSSVAGSPPWNSASVIDSRGQVLGTYRKIHLFSPAREHEHFAPGGSVLVVPLSIGGHTWQVCPLVCYDLRFPELFRIAALAGAEIFAVGANWPSARAHHWRALAIARAIENQAYVVACNRVGKDPLTEYSGGSIIVGPDGTVLAEAGHQTAIIHAQADREALLRWRDRFPALRDARRSLIGDALIDRSPIH